MAHHPVVSHEEWLAARIQFLIKEKEFTRLRDELSKQRRELPWEKVDKQYVFDGPNGKETLSDLFDGRSQLIVYHFMYAPGWENGCIGCSFLSDHFDGALPHLNHRDVTFVAISRAPRADFEPFKKRMGWNFKWLSSYENDFNYDYDVSFRPEDKAKGEVVHNYKKCDMTASPLEDMSGTSVFYKDENGGIFHTYSTYERGDDLLIGTYNFLDMVPKGRDEDGFEFSMAWLRHHDRYDNYVLNAQDSYPVPKQKDSCCH